MRLEEDVNPVDMLWLDNFLELRKSMVHAGWKAPLEKERIQICDPKELGEITSSISSQAGKAMVCKRDRGQINRPAMKTKKDVIGQSKVVCGGRVFVVKGLREFLKKGKRNGLARLRRSLCPL